MQELLYWMLAQAPSNIFVLLMMEDLCHRTLVPVEEHRRSTPYLFTAVAVVMTGADLFHNSFLTMAVTCAFIGVLIGWLYARERPYIRLVMAGVFCLLISASDMVGFGLWSAGRMIGYNGGNPLVCQAIGGQFFLLLVFILMRWYIRAAVNVYHSNESTWFWVCLIVPGVSLPTIGVFWRLAMTGHYSNQLDMAMMLCCTALLFGCQASFRMFENIASQMEVTREYQAIRLRQEMEKRHYDLVQRKNEQYASAAHDLKHHLRCLSDMAKQGQLDSIRSYIAGMQQEEKRRRQDEYLRMFTQDRVLNVILSEKARIAADEEIKFTADLTAGLDFLDSLDSCALMGNLLDNALEGARTTLPGKERFVRMQIRPFNQGFVLVRVENSFSGFLREKNGRLLSTKDEGGRGYGMQSIAQIAEKTGGSMEYESHDGIFTVNVLLNLLLSEEEPLRP